MDLVHHHHRLFQALSHLFHRPAYLYAGTKDCGSFIGSRDSRVGDFHHGSYYIPVQTATAVGLYRKVHIDGE